MSYTYKRHLPNTAIDDAEMRLREALKEKGFRCTDRNRRPGNNEEKD